MTMATRFHIAEPVNPEKLFLHVLGVLESDPTFVPAWEKAADGWGATAPGPLSLGKATYQHVHKGDQIFRANGEPFCHATNGEPFLRDESAFMTTLGQGLPAIWEVKYAEDGPLEWPNREDTNGEPDDDWGNSADPLVQHLVSGDFDTAYGYRAPNGAGCGDLHAFLLTEVRTYLESVGCTEWSWLHEEQGTWHQPAEIYLRGDPILGAF